MNLIRVAKNNLFKDIKQYSLCILTIAVSTAIIFSSINMTESSALMKVLSGSSAGDNGNFLSMGIRLSQLVNVCLSCVMSGYVAHFFITTKIKEVGIVIISGGSITQTSLYIGIQTLIIELIGIFIGFILGFILVPCYSYIINITLNANLPLMDISLTALGLAGIFVIIQCFSSVLIATGFCYRNSILDLINYNDNVTLVDKGIFYKAPPKAYLIMYILSIFLLYSVSGSDETILRSLFIATIVCLISINIIKDWIPDFINKKRKKGDLFLKETMIWTGNISDLIMKTIILLETMMAGIITFQTPLFTVAKIEPAKLLVYESHLSVFLFLISFSILFKVITEINKRKNMYKQLNIMGYSYNQIINTIRKEVIAYYLIFSVLALLPLVIISIAKIIKTSISSIYVCKLLLLPLLAIVLLGVITYILYKKIVFKTIKGC